MKTMVRLVTTSRPGAPQKFYDRNTESFVDWDSVDAVSLYPANALDGSPGFRPTLHLRNGSEHFAMTVIPEHAVPAVMATMDACLRQTANTEGFADLDAYIADPAAFSKKYGVLLASD